MSPEVAAEIDEFKSLSEGTVMTAPWARVAPRNRLREKMRMEDFMIKKNYFTVAPVDSMVTLPPTGTAIGATSNPSTMGLLVVRPSGM